MRKLAAEFFALIRARVLGDFTQRRKDAKQEG